MHLPARGRLNGIVTRVSKPAFGAATPFLAEIGAEEAVAHRAWTEARSQVLEAVLAGPCLVVVLGSTGTGKTLLLQDLAWALRGAGASVLVQPRDDLPLEAANPRDAGRRRVVLVDDADQMNEAALERLGRLGRCAVVLAGLSNPGDGKGLRGAKIVRLAPLAPDEVEAFVAARLAQSGLRTDMIDAAAVARLAERSGGIPRLVNGLAGRALSLARSEGAARVGAGHVDEAATLQIGDADSARASPILPRRLGRAALALGAVTVVAAACGWLLLGHGPGAGLALSPPGAAMLPQPSPARVAVMPSLRGLPNAPAAPPAASQPPALQPGAPQPGAPTADALPTGALVRVVVRYARGSADGAARAAALAWSLRAAGFSVSGQAADLRRAGKPGVSYFFAEDRAAAEAVLQAAGLAGESALADPTGLDAQPAPGLVQLVVPPSRHESPGNG